MVIKTKKRSQVCPCVPSFVFAELFIPSFNVMSDYFMFHSIWSQFLCLDFKNHDFVTGKKPVKCNQKNLLKVAQDYLRLRRIQKGFHSN